ncbi:programmed cell death 1 ligand 1-like [Scomber japonicus]|uniref:programmed cell death 1 ligand 1-like n=1 Tax=Scomber japonicus TaxID=13676 RepID=UPI002305BCE8|nr:programmed cell death 1 ligand 1-like [Scomber japonicus]
MLIIFSHGAVILWMILVLVPQVSVSSETVVQAYIKDNVLLPCSYDGTLSDSDSVTVSWRDKDDKNVLDIKKNSPDVEEQHENFKNRVKSFSDQYMKGNFSIILQDVKQEDAGVYECNIRIGKRPKPRVRLNVTGDRPKAATTPPGPPGGAAAVTQTSIQLLLCLCCSLSLSVLL